MAITRRYRYLATPDAINRLCAIQAGEFDDGFEVELNIDSKFDFHIVGFLVTTEEEAKFLNSIGYEATSYEYIRDNATRLLDSPDKIVNIYVDSPGGYVAGIEKTIKKMETLKNHKQIHIYTDGMIASAAYWLSSISNSITATSMAQIGSIGVYTTMTDLSKMNERYGIVKHLISSGTLKGAGESGVEITEEQLEAEQSIIDGIAERFYTSVEKYRFLDKAYKTGGIYLAERALEMGLIESITDDDYNIIDTSMKETIKMSNKKSDKLEIKAGEVLAEEELDEKDVEDSEDNMDEDELALEEEEGEEENEDELDASEDEDNPDETLDDADEEGSEEVEEDDEVEDDAEKEKARCLEIIETFAFAPDFAKRMISENKSIVEAKVEAYDLNIKASGEIGVAKIDGMISPNADNLLDPNEHPIVSKARALAKSEDIPFFKAMEKLARKNPGEYTDYFLNG